MFQKDFLKLVPYFPNVDENTVLGKLIDDTLAYVPSYEYDHNNWWYLHGELEDFVGFDKGHFINCYSAGLSKNTINWSGLRGQEVTDVRGNEITPKMYAVGEFDVKIVGSQEKAIFVAWVEDEREIVWKGRKFPDWRQCGYVVFASDLKALEEARKEQARWFKH